MFDQRWLRRPAVVLLGLAVLAAAPASALAAAVTQAQASEARLRRDVTFLASPACEGRGPLTRGIDKAADYIAAEFKKTGLKPGNGTSYFQPFTIAGTELLAPAKLVLKGPLGQVIELKQGVHFQPMGLAAGGKVSDAEVVFAGFGMSSPATRANAFAYDDYAGLDVANKIVVVLRDVPRTGQRDAPRSLRVLGSLTRKLAEAQKRKAAAVLFVNDLDAVSTGDDLLDFNFTALSAAPTRLPAAHLRRSVLDNMLLASHAKTLDDVERGVNRDLKPNSLPLTGWTASLEVQSRRGKIPLKNVVGVLEGSGPLAKETVVIGAHYDHLGYGGPSSMAGGKKMAVHPGADDNGSGTTAVLELARRFAALGNRQGRRLVFITFSGEELGLYGSRHYCKEPLFPLADTAAMYNLDMVGRLSSDPKTGKDKLLCEGGGTAKEFKPLLEEMGKKYEFQLTVQASGFGPSDHDSFCAKKVPVLFFWTGYHADYHRPSDTADKINLSGMRRIVDMSQEIVARWASADKPAFVVVKGSGALRPSSGPRGPGIRPGYGDEGEGVLVEGVTDGGPAGRGGIKAEDRIVAIAGKPVKNLQTYMEALAGQKGGTTIEVVVMRVGKKVPLKIKLD